MNQQERQAFIDKYLQGNSSEQERSAIETWYLSRTEETTDNQAEPDYPLLEDKIWLNVTEAIRTDEKRMKVRKMRFQLTRYAAAAILVLSIGIGMFIYLRKNVPITKDENSLAETIHPGGNKAYLTLSDGKRIDLTAAKNGELANQSGISVAKSADGQLIYTVKNQGDNAKLGYNTIETPRGGQYQINLPDGTKVWLNAASSLKYPVSFASLKDRRVELSGEAYFEVAKNKKLPFRVISNKQTVEVLGTHFNINSYSDEPVVKTTLIEGSVKVIGSGASGTKTISPGEQAISNGSSISISQADIAADTDWKNGDFIFRDESIESVMRKISRWYNVEVVYDGKVTQNNFGGTISRSKNIAAVLRVLEETEGVHFTIEGRRIIVKQ